MIKNIAFDMGGVLLDFDVEKVVGRFLPDPAKAREFANLTMSSFEWRQYDRGVYTRKKMVDSIDARMPDEYKGILKKLCLDQIFAERDMPQFDEMEPLVRELRDNGYRLLLLSNAGYDIEIYSKSKPVLDMIPERLASCYYHLLKPEKEIYELFFKMFGVDPAECVFIDDVRENVEGSKACGMDAICFSPARAPVSELRRELAERGVRVSC